MDFWLLHLFTGGQGIYHEQAKDLPYYVVLGYVDAKLKEESERQERENK